jgi:formylmethanofuran dehydrogenase subunit D
MAERFLLIAGRTSRQGIALNKSKYGPEYWEEISTVQMDPGDMDRLGLTDGMRVRLFNKHGSVVACCQRAKPDELAPGVLFLPYGDLSSRLMSGDTGGTGMPESKGIEVWLEVLSDGRPEPVQPDRTGKVQR